MFEVPGVLRSPALAATVDAIAAAQLPSGCIPWFEGGHADPWDHIEAAMALDVGGRHNAAERAYEWLRKTQRGDGAWAASYRDGMVADATLDANFIAYIATGVWHHRLSTNDDAFLERMWPCVERAIDFVLDLQAAEGSILWARDEHWRAWPGALLTSSSCIHLSLRCAVAIAETLGHERPDWELSVGALGAAIRRRPECFEPKERFSMDWYYPVLGGALQGQAARAQIEERWDVFVVEGLGARCVADRPWVTSGESAELVLALDAAGLDEPARRVFEWIQHLRADDGSYWTGSTFPDGALWPEERPTWGSAAVVLAAAALASDGPAAGLFRGEGLPQPVEVSEAVADPL